MISNTSHYYVNKVLFIEYMDAIVYCDNHMLEYNIIIKSKTYTI